jgi:hypothetical protein
MKSIGDSDSEAEPSILNAVRAIYIRNSDGDLEPVNSVDLDAGQELMVFPTADGVVLIIESSGSDAD